MQRVAIARALVNDPPSCSPTNRPAASTRANPGTSSSGHSRNCTAKDAPSSLITLRTLCRRHADRILVVKDGSSSNRHQYGAAETEHADLPETIDLCEGDVPRRHGQQDRSGLTMLGIVIGIASVIALLAVGQGAKPDREQYPVHRLQPAPRDAWSAARHSGKP